MASSHFATLQDGVMILVRVCLSYLTPFSSYCCFTSDILGFISTDSVTALFVYTVSKVI